jgi:type IV pilus assembly protein PilC
MVQRLRAALWRAASYPLMVLLALLLVLGFIWAYVMPKFGALAGAPSFADQLHYYHTWSTPPSPMYTSPLDLFIPIARQISFGLMALIASVLLAVVFVSILSRLPLGARLLRPVVLRLPLIGPIMRWNLLARWCDALHLGTSAGMDLPASISLASNAVDSPELQDDGAQLIHAISTGGAMNAVGPTRLLPPLVPEALQLGAEQNDLPAAAAMLAKMYREQAEIRLSVLPQVLSPLLLLLTALCISLAIASALLPLVAVLRELMR